MSVIVLWGPSFDGSTPFEVSARFLLGIGMLLHYPSSGVGNQLGYAFDFEFVFDTRAVSVHCLCTEMKLAGDLLRRESLADQLEDFKLAVGKLLDDGALGRVLPAGNALQYPCRHLLADVELPA